MKHGFTRITRVTGAAPLAVVVLWVLPVLTCARRGCPACIQRLEPIALTPDSLSSLGGVYELPPLLFCRLTDMPLEIEGIPPETEGRHGSSTGGGAATGSANTNNSSAISALGGYRGPGGELITTMPLALGNGTSTVGYVRRKIEACVGSELKGGQLYKVDQASGWHFGEPVLLKQVKQRALHTC